MELWKVLRERRSIRRFESKKVPPSVIEKIVEAGTWAPSASNRQHWEFIVIDKKSVTKKLVSEAGAQPIIQNSPVVIAVLYDKQFNALHHANIQSVSAAVQNMLLSSHELGYGTCWVSGFGDEKRAEKILNVPGHLGILCLVMVGKSSEKPFAPARRDISSKLFFNHYEGGVSGTRHSIRSSRWDLEGIRKNQSMSSRSSYLGKDYEIYGDDDITNMKSVLARTLPPKGARILNMMGYDGTVLRKLKGILSRHEVTDYELTDEGKKFVEFKIKYPKFITSLNKEKPGSFDFVTMFFSLEKVPERKRFLREAHRLLRPGGKLIMFFKNSKSLYGLLYFGMERVLGIDTVERFYMNSGPFEPLNCSGMGKLVSSVGFSVTRKGFNFVPSETEIFRGGIGSYSKKQKLSGKRKVLVNPAFSLLGLLKKVAGSRGFSVFSSTIAIVAEKKGVR